jgi:hypothetical protein
MPQNTRALHFTGTLEISWNRVPDHFSVPVTVANATNQPPISFKLDVMPVFMKAG